MKLSIVCMCCLQCVYLFIVVLLLSHRSWQPHSLGLTLTHVFTACSTSSVSAIAKLSKPAPPSSTPSQKTQSGEKKETPQERLKRIMSKQLNKQSKYRKYRSNWLRGVGADSRALVIKSF